MTRSFLAGASLAVLLGTTALAQTTATPDVQGAGSAVATTGAQPAITPPATPEGAVAGGAGTAAEVGTVSPNESGEDEGEDDDDEAAQAAQAAPAAAPAAQRHDYGPSGIMIRSNREDLPTLVLASGKPVHEGEIVLQSGGYYRMAIEADGSAELALSGGDFFRAIWINEVVINDIEIRPMGVHSLEFDAAGKAVISFIAIVPGQYSLAVPGSSGDSQRARFVIR